MTNAAKVVLSAEDRSAAAFATFTRGLDKAGLSANAFKTNVAGLLAGISVGALATFTKNIINSVDALNDVADATGASVENISALEGIAKRTGANFDTVSSALIKFNGVLSDAKPDQGAGAVLKALNVDIQALKRLDPAEALLQVAKATETLGSEQDKARVYQELFGKSTKEVAAFMKDLSEQRRLEATATTEQAKAAEQFNKEIFKLQANASEAARVLTMGLVPAINKLVDNMRLAAAYSNGFLSFLTLPGAANATEKIKEYQARLDGLLEDRKRYERAGSDTSGLDQAIATAARSVNYLKAVANAEQLSRITFNDADQSEAETYRLGIKRRLNVPSKPDGGSGGGSATPKDPYADAKRYLDSLQGQLQSAKALTATEKLLDDIRRGSLGKFTPELEKQLRATAAQVDATKALADAEKERAQNQKGLDDLVADIGRRDQERLRVLLGDTQSAKIQRQVDDLDLLEQAYKNGAMGIVGSAEALRMLKEASDQVLTPVSKAGEAMDAMAQSALQAAERIQGALGDELANILSGEFDNIGDSFSKLIQRMVAEAAAAKIMDSLFGTVDASTKQRSGGGLLDDAAKWLGNLIASANGNVFPAGPGISAYSSQVVSKPTIFPFAKGVGLMGEAGAEAIMPLRRDSAGRLGVSAAGASVTVNVINQSGQPVSAQQRSRSGPNGEQIVDVVLAAIGESLANRSGPVARGLESGYGLRPAMA